MVTDYDLSPRVPENPKQFAQRLLCPTAIIALLLNHFDTRFGSSNIHYVNQFIRGFPPPA